MVFTAASAIRARRGPSRGASGRTPPPPPAPSRASAAPRGRRATAGAAPLPLFLEGHQPMLTRRTGEESRGGQRLLRRSSRCQHSQNSAVRQGKPAGERARASGERCGRTLPRREPLLPDLPGLVHRFDDKERRPEHILLPRGARRGGAAGMGWLVLCGTAQRHPTKGAATAQNDVNMKRSGGVQRAAYRPRPQSSPCRGRNPGQNPSKQRSTEGRGCVAAHSVPPCSALSVAASQTEDAASRIAAA